MASPSNSNQHERFCDEIELLVEDALSPARRRELIAHLEQEPAAWRTLALAFMEQQKIRRAMRMAGQDHRQMTTSLAKIDRATQHQTPPSDQRWTSMMMLAATALLAFVVGMGSAQILPTTVQSNPEVAGDQPAQTSPQLSDVIPQPESGDESPPPQDQLDLPYRIVGYVKWQGDHRIHLSPVFFCFFDDAWLEANPPQVDEKLQRIFARAGWQVRPERRFVSVRLSGGENYTIPMDDMTFQYVGREVF